MKNPTGAAYMIINTWCCQKDGLKFPAFWLLVATKRTRGSEDLERALSKEGISFL